MHWRKVLLAVVAVLTSQQLACGRASSPRANTQAQLSIALETWPETVVPGESGHVLAIRASNHGSAALDLSRTSFRWSRDGIDDFFNYRVAASPENATMLSPDESTVLTFTLAVSAEAAEGATAVDVSLAAALPSGAALLAWLNTGVRVTRAGALTGRIAAAEPEVLVGESAAALTVAVTHDASEVLSAQSVDLKFTHFGADLTADYTPTVVIAPNDTGGQNDTRFDVAVRVSLGAQTGPIEIWATVNGIPAEAPAQWTVLALALVVTRQPSGAYVNSNFAAQPAVRLVDPYNQTVARPGLVTLSAPGAQGDLSGDLDVELVNGIAEFTGVGFDGAETDVALRASFGPYSVDFAPTDVTLPAPGACLADDAFFTSAGGGCMDMATRLVWSARGPAPLPWAEVVWDATLADALAADADDMGRTNDLPEKGTAPCPGCDTSPSAYCHSLTEGAARDWRAPAQETLQTLAVHLQSAPGAYMTTGWFWSSTRLSPGAPFSVNTVDGSAAITTESAPVSVICVRGGRLPASNLAITDAPDAMVANLGSSGTWRLALQDDQGRPINAEGVPVSISSTTLGALGGSLIAFTDGGGTVVFDAWSLDTPGVATLTFDAGIVPPVTSSVTVLPVAGACLPHPAFTTAGGGCTDLSSGLVWSAPSPGPFSWHEAVWDGTLVGNAQPDEHDSGRTNDYALSGSYCENGNCDRGTKNYCHALVEGDQRDWRLPTAAEASEVTANFAGGAMALRPGLSSSTFTASLDGSSYPIYVNLNTGATSSLRMDTGRAQVYCVRGGRSAPDHLEVLTVAPMLHGAVPYTPLTLAVREPSGAPVNVQGMTVTLTSTSLGTLGGVLSAQTNAYGIAKFAQWTLDTPGTATVTAQAAGLADLELLVTVDSFPHTCVVNDALFQTQEGGCKDLATKLVWSQGSTTLMTWDDAIWDSTSPSSPIANSQPDADDAGRVDDYTVGALPVARDTSLLNYCHESLEGGFSDWRMPTAVELGLARDAGGPTHFSAASVGVYYSSTVAGGGSAGGEFAYRECCRRTKDYSAPRDLCARGGVTPNSTTSHPRTNVPIYPVTHGS